MFNIQRKHENSGKPLVLLENEKLVSAYLNLVAKVLRAKETHVCIAGIDSLFIFFDVLSQEMMLKYKENIYGYLLRSLSY